MATTPGERLGSYRLLNPIGEGGMGVVYQGIDDAGRDVAVKLLKPEITRDATFRQRLIREVETMRRVRSRRVAEVIDADISGDRPYIVTRYIAGQSLDDAVRATGLMSGRPLGRVATGLAEALVAIHQAGVVHRDLKPGNVLLTEEGPVVIDFGIAHAVDATRITQTGMIVGTPGYMAPEVIDGRRQPGPAVDVYAWAATVAFAATGRSPFGGGSLEAVIARIIQGRPDLDGIPANLAVGLRAALAREPGQRPTSAQLAGWVCRLDLTASEPYRESVPYPPPYPPSYPPSYPPPGPVPTHPPVGSVRTRPPPRPVSTHPPPVAPRVGLGWYKLLAYLMVVLVVSASAVLPAVTVAVVTVAAWYLRAGDSAVRSRRVPLRGVRDLLVAPWRRPGSLSASAVLTALCLPYAAVGGVVAAFVLLFHRVNNVFPVAAVAQWAVVVCTYMMLAGPGIMGPRRQLVRLISALARDRRSTFQAGLVLGCVAVLAVGVAWLAWPRWWPVDPPYDALRSIGRLLRDGVSGSGS